MPDPDLFTLLSNNDLKFSASESLYAQSTISVLSAVVSVLKTSNQKWLQYHNYAFPAGYHRSRSKRLDLTPSVPSSLSTAVGLRCIIFNSLVTRACHLEYCSSMTTDSFLNAFRRFIARRGHPRLLRSDNGKNFVAARRELQACLTMGSLLFRRKFLTSKKSVVNLILLLHLTLVVPGKR